MENCPSCKTSIILGVLECPNCGLIFEKWKNRQVNPPPKTAGSASPPPDRVGKSILRIFLFLSLLGGAGFLIFKKNPTVTSYIDQINPQSARTTAAKIENFQITNKDVSDFDQSITLIGSPSGLVWTGQEFISANRADPLGFLRINPLTKEMKQWVVKEPRYNQKLGFGTLCWNGKELIGYTMGSWFQLAIPDVFTLLDPANLEVKKIIGAPPLLGALAWDGKNYWAGTRRNTEDSGEPAFLYRLDENLKVIDKFDPPAFGCQGLAWDGSYLWWADVFTDKIHLIDIFRNPPAPIHAYETNLPYLSGIAFDGAHIWVSEYGTNGLHRLNPKLAELWKQGDYRIKSFVDIEVFQRVLASVQGGDAAIEKLIEPLKSQQLDAAETNKMVDALLSMGAVQEIKPILEKMASDPTYSINQDVIQSQLARLKEPPNSQIHSVQEAQTATNFKPGLEPPEGPQIRSVYNSFHQAIMSKDVATIKRHLKSDKRAELDDAAKSEFMLELIQKLVPKNVEIAGVTVDGSQATLHLQDKDNVKGIGTTTLIKEEGEWRISEENWKFKMD